MDQLGFRCTRASTPNSFVRAIHQTSHHLLRSRSPSFGNSSSSAVAFLSPRSTAFAKRSQSFIDRSPTNQNSGYPSPVSSPSPLHGWGSPTRKLDWGVQGEELHKLRKSSSIGIRTNSNTNRRSPAPGDPEISWPSPSPSPSLHTKGSGPMDRLDEESHAQFHLSSGKIPTWAEQICLDQEQTVAH